MTTFSERADRLTARLESQGIDALLVTSLVNVRYLTGFTGTSGLALMTPERRVFVTDFRYVERAAAEVPDYERVRGSDDLLGSVVDLITDGVASARIGFDEASMPVRTHARLQQLVGGAAELVPAGGIVEQQRAVKDAGELDAIARATAMADEAYRWLIDHHGLAGHTERQVARALERHVEDLGAESVSFPPIVAAGENGALPHAEPRAVEIPRDTLVVVDFGCMLDGYCSDCTRTFATGEVEAEAREAYELVCTAQAAALAAVAAGADVRAVDGAAREHIEAAGQGELFGHGTGHGVGLEVHEAPRVSPRGEGSLAAGQVVTVEPGVYLPGRFGVRIEDLVVVEEGGSRVLTAIPKELTII